MSPSDSLWGCLQAGLDFLFFARISRPNWQKRNREKTNEFVWRASEHLGEQGQVSIRGILNAEHWPRARTGLGQTRRRTL